MKTQRAVQKLSKIRALRSADGGRGLLLRLRGRQPLERAREDLVPRLPGREREVRRGLVAHADELPRRVVVDDLFAI